MALEGTQRATFEELCNSLAEETVNDDPRTFRDHLLPSSERRHLLIFFLAIGILSYWDAPPIIRAPLEILSSRLAPVRRVLSRLRRLAARCMEMPFAPVRRILLSRLRRLAARCMEIPAPLLQPPLFLSRKRKHPPEADEERPRKKRRTQNEGVDEKLQGLNQDLGSSGLVIGGHGDQAFKKGSLLPYPSLFRASYCSDPVSLGSLATSTSSQQAQHSQASRTTDFLETRQ